MDTPIDLPDVYEVRQGTALGAAIEQARETGDLSPALKIVDHLAAEADMDRDFMMALILFRQSVDAQTAGDPELAEVYVGLARSSFAPETLRQVSMMSKLTAGMRQGWLPAEGHDELAAYLDEAGADAVSLKRVLATVERRANG
ncbi:hypothetical protein [Amycolatopsis kentuckyensis]|uniref:hypothetical protein n=1 Tax=Amycolatopsis kentuckyensis TaxID=218823 RepID=UPI003563EB76